jgi:predicted nucleic acid-binding protein
MTSSISWLGTASPRARKRQRKCGKRLRVHGDTCSQPQPMTAVSNSSPLILYSSIGQLELFKRLFTDVLVPPAVWHEVVTDGSGRAGARELQQASWIRRQPLPNLEMPRALSVLHSGEREAIALASSLRPGVGVPIILDDRRARQLARDVGLVVVGSGGILGLAKKAGLITSI